MMDIEVPHGWEITTVGELAEYYRGVTYKKDQSSVTPQTGMLPILRANNIAGSLIFDDLVFVEEHLVGDDQKILTGDIVFAMSSGSKKHVGKSAVAARDFEGGFGAFCGLLRPSKYINNTFLAHQFMSRKFRNYIESISKGTNINNLKRQHLTDYKVVLPPINEQNRIVAKVEQLLSELDKGTESLNTARKQLNIYRQSVLKHAFEGKLTEQWREENRKNLETAEKHLAHIKLERDARYQPRLAEWKDAVKAWEAEDKQGKKPSKPNQPKEPVPFTKNELDDLPKLPSTWKYARLGAFIEDIQAGKSFKCDEREPNSVEIGVAKVSAVSWGEYDERECKTCVDPERINPDLFIRTDDFLFSRANTIELVGACVIVQSTRKNIMLSDKTLRIHFASGQKGYFLQYLRSHSGRNEIMRRSTGNQDSMRNIGQDRIRSIITPACSAAEMAEIEKELAERFSLVEALDAAIEDELARSEALHQSILRRAFSGQLVVQDPNDEPASVLLKRIKVDKFAQLEHRKTNKKGKQAA